MAPIGKHKMSTGTEKCIAAARAARKAGVPADKRPYVRTRKCKNGGTQLLCFGTDRNGPHSSKCSANHLPPIPVTMPPKKRVSIDFRNTKEMPEKRKRAGRKRGPLSTAYGMDEDAYRCVQAGGKVARKKSECGDNEVPQMQCLSPSGHYVGQPCRETMSSGKSILKKKRLTLEEIRERLTTARSQGREKYAAQKKEKASWELARWKGMPKEEKAKVAREYKKKYGVTFLQYWKAK